MLNQASATRLQRCLPTYVIRRFPQNIVFLLDNFGEILNFHLI